MLSLFGLLGFATQARRDLRRPCQADEHYPIGVLVPSHLCLSGHKQVQHYVQQLLTVMPQVTFTESEVLSIGIHRWTHGGTYHQEPNGGYAKADL